jgi:hypothetical protein
MLVVAALSANFDGTQFELLVMQECRRNKKGLTMASSRIAGTDGAHSSSRPVCHGGRRDGK